MHRCILASWVHASLSNKTTCVLAENEYMHICWTRTHVWLLNRSIWLLNITLSFTVEKNARILHGDEHGHHNSTRTRAHELLRHRQGLLEEEYMHSCVTLVPQYMYSLWTRQPVSDLNILALHEASTEQRRRPPKGNSTFKLHLSSTRWCRNHKKGPHTADINYI